ncbi:MULTISPECIES: hypothetical protein [unclassified Streptomyces]|uniref:hypothetical protein n=1 Tax=unclassified Streptomyces TaxID=2593676 RepID=UPI00159F1D35|nr:hypothetical protein [Streptomyces sp. DvalAA-14]
MSPSRTAVEIPAGAPRPEPIRFFGTTWVRRDGGYLWRRAAATVGSLLAAVAGVLAVRFGIEGLAGISSVMTLVVLGGFVLSSALAFRRTWLSLTRREPGTAERGAEPEPEPAPVPERSVSSLVAIGFVGALLAYFVRSLVEAPGERLHRAEYEEARARHARRRSARSGNPAADPGTFL